MSQIEEIVAAVQQVAGELDNDVIGKLKEAKDETEECIGTLVLVIGENSGHVGSLQTLVDNLEEAVNLAAYVAGELGQVDASNVLSL